MSYSCLNSLFLLSLFDFNDGDEQAEVKKNYDAIFRERSISCTHKYEMNGKN